MRGTSWPPDEFSTSKNGICLVELAIADEKLENHVWKVLVFLLLRDIR
jgi:hypothetical protein